MFTVSVVVPTYNRAELIGPTVESILRQSHPPSEVIIVDDGSTDKTARVCAAMPAPVKYVRQENTGLPGARNRGILESTGDWIAFCDSDDLWTERKLELQMAALQAAPDARWCLTNLSLIDPDGQPVQRGGSALEHVFGAFADAGMSPREWLHRSLARLEVDGSVGGYRGDVFEMFFAGNLGLPSSALVARSLVDEAGMFDDTFLAAEDTEFFHRLAASSPVVFLMDPLVRYRVGHASMNSTMDRAPFIRNSLISLDRAARLRSPLTPVQRVAYREGKERLWNHLAYYRLSVLDSRGARRAVRDAWRDGIRTPALGGVLLGSLIPGAGLKALHGLKRTLRGSLSGIAGSRAGGGDH